MKKNITGKPAAFTLLILRAILGVSLTFGMALVSCDNSPESNDGRLSYDEAVKKVIFSGNTAAVDFENLYHNDIYLVKVNTSDLIVDAANTGGVVGALGTSASGVGSGLPAAEGRAAMYHRDYKAAQEFNANPPPFNRERGKGARAAADIVSYEIGDKKNFWVEIFLDSDYWVYRPATLMASGMHGNFWVMDENTPSGTGEFKISETTLQDLAGIFDLIYPLETNLFGYEYGGGPDGDGGVDGDKKIQILIYNIVEKDGDGSVMGYFSSKDLYTQDELDSKKVKTNQAEIFYINARWVVNSPEYIYSTMIHEFQHMIHFSRKVIEHEVNSDTWYNEMLSMAAEDVIAPLIGRDYSSDASVFRKRIPYFLASYNESGLEVWDGSMAAYGMAYAFGSYLVRNYGGPELLKRLIDNDKTGVDSVTMALKEISGDLDFEQAFNRFGEAVIFSGPSMPQGVLTFDKTITSSINKQQYTAYKFDIWQAPRYHDDEKTGPLVLNLSENSMKPHSINIRSDDEWKDVTGNFSITLFKPSDENVVLYLMVR